MIHAVAYSGGKDSTALLLHLRERGVHFQAVFCDTGWEHPLTLSYINMVNERLLGGHLITVRSVKHNGMLNLISTKKRVPSSQARFCTEELKVKPMIKWIADQVDEVTVYQGIRAQESASRAAMPMRQWSDDYDAWLERPLLKWSVDDVFAIHRRHEIDPNPLYTMGHERVGCFPCIMVNQRQLKSMSERSPEVWSQIDAAEMAAGGRSFFAPNYIPSRFHTGFDEKSGKTYPTASDVKAYVLREEQAMLDGTQSVCMSIYNLCE